MKVAPNLSTATILRFIQLATVMATKATVEEFDVEELCDFLLSSGDVSEDAVDRFRSKRISGSTFFELDEADFKELIPCLGDRKIVQKVQKSFLPSQTVSARLWFYTLITSMRAC